MNNESELVCGFLILWVDGLEHTNFDGNVELLCNLSTRLLKYVKFKDGAKFFSLRSIFVSDTPVRDINNTHRIKFIVHTCCGDFLYTSRQTNVDNLNDTVHICLYRMMRKSLVLVLKKLFCVFIPHQYLDYTSTDNKEILRIFWMKFSRLEYIISLLWLLSFTLTCRSKSKTQKEK